LSARPANIAASLDPMVEQPTAGTDGDPFPDAGAGTLQGRASMFTQRSSSSALAPLAR
jgi:hypothetical protein